MKTLGIDPMTIETIVLSHGHYDHTGGLPWLDGQSLICHPEALRPKFRKSNGTPMGVPVSEEIIRKKFRVTATKEPYWLSDDVVFLGEIPRLNNFESQFTPFITVMGEDDFMPDDTGVVIVSDKGLIVVSGCAHSGICNMVEHAIAITGIHRINTVMGGFHLKEDDEVTRKTIDYLNRIGVEKLYPSHCTAALAREAFARYIKINDVRSGIVINF